MTKSRAQMRIEQYSMQKKEWWDKVTEGKILPETAVKEIDKLDRKIKKLCLDIYNGKFPNK